MVEHADEACERREQLQHVLKTDPDPRVRRRAHAVLLVEEGHPKAGVARLFHTSAYRVHVWQERFASAGRDGLADRARGGRPSKLTADDRAFVEEALDRGPQAYGLPHLVWTLRDLQALLQRERGVEVSVVTVHRVVHDLGFRSRRPRHDLTHRQDLAAVAAEPIGEAGVLEVADPLFGPATLHVPVVERERGVKAGGDDEAEDGALVQRLGFGRPPAFQAGRRGFESRLPLQAA